MKHSDVQTEGVGLFYETMRIRITDNESQWSHIELLWPIHRVSSEGNGSDDRVQSRRPFDFSTKNNKYRICRFFLSVCPCTVGVALGFQIFLRYPQSYSILVARVTGGQSGCLQAQSSQMHASRSHILSLHFKPAGKKGLDFGSPRHQQIDAK